MKHAADLSTEEMQALLWIGKKRVKRLEVHLAKRIKDSSDEATTPGATTEPKPKTTCVVCCEHVWRNRSIGPRDNGEYDLVCERCGLAY